jgi:hypothetical protein
VPPNIPEVASILAVIPDIDKVTRMNQVAARSLDLNASGAGGG